jgi:hypothetical protein
MPLYDHDGQARYYAPWRPDPRPLGGLFQGAYAFLAVADFWRVERLLLDRGRAAAAEVRFQRWRERVDQVLDVLHASGRLRPEGLLVLARLRATLDGWRDEPVSASARRAAGLVAREHQSQWQARNTAVAGTR